MGGASGKTGEQQRSCAALTAAMDRYADGEADAFGTVYDHLAPRLRAFFRRSTRDHASADDLLQQTFVNIHRGRQCFVHGSDVVPWAFAIARRLLIDSARKRKREAFLSSSDEETSPLDLSMAEDGSPDEITWSKELAARAHAELGKLPEGQREAYELVRGDGLSVSEAADVLGISGAAVKQRVFRAYEALRAALARA